MSDLLDIAEQFDDGLTGIVDGLREVAPQPYRHDHGVGLAEQVRRLASAVEELTRGLMKLGRVDVPSLADVVEMLQHQIESMARPEPAVGFLRDRDGQEGIAADIMFPDAGGGDWLYAEITGGSQAAGYTWKEKEAVAGGTWQDKSGGRTHADDGKAYAARNITGTVASGTVVVMFKVTTSTATTEWRFAPVLPTPSTKYMVLSVDSGGAYWQEDDVRSP